MPDARRQPLYLQRNQPDGVPPLALTGERTLPDVPEENYWYRRHLVVYEWIRAAGRRPAGRRHGLRRGLRVSTCSPARAAQVVGVDANPEAHEHARLRYTAAPPALRARPRRAFDEPADAVVFLQTIEHVANPDEVLEHFKAMTGPGRHGRRLHAERPDAARPRAPRSRATRGTSRSTGPRSSARCAPRTSATSSSYGLFHARKLAVHSSRSSSLGWDAIHKRAAASPSASTTGSRRRSRSPTSR